MSNSAAAKTDTPRVISSTAEDASGEATDIKCLSLEMCFEELERIVAALEGQNASLEESLRLFERGMQISARCTSELARVEKRIQIIVENTKTGELQAKEFEPGDESESG